MHCELAMDSEGSLGLELETRLQAVRFDWMTRSSVVSVASSSYTSIIHFHQGKRRSPGCLDWIGKKVCVVGSECERS